MAANRDRIYALVTRIQDAFLDAPGMTLTLDKAAARFRSDAPTCQAVLDALVDSSVLARTRAGEYVRYYPHAFANAA